MYTRERQIVAGWLKLIILIKNNTTMGTYRVDIRKSKRGCIIRSFWTDSFDRKPYQSCYINVYQYFGKRLIKVMSFEPKQF